MRWHLVEMSSRRDVISITAQRVVCHVEIEGIAKDAKSAKKKT